ncbi:MAG TPA: amidase [Reyranella sp.]|nr:amidase [Reyranella sp.]
MNDFGAFVPGPRARLKPTASGPLDGLTFVVKDLIDVEGHVTGAGNPDWAARQTPAATSAPVVERLLRAGATLVGKTVTDELAFSLEGENHHYGTPVNPRAPDRLPGGSSSGSAVAVAAGLADLGLGTDTGGSVRVPASFCGVHGYRPSHGRVPLDGVVPFAPSYDTVGLFARNAECLQDAAHCLLGTPPLRPARPRLLLATDAFALAEPEAAAALRTAALRLGVDDEVEVFAKRPAEFVDAYAILQGLDIAKTLAGFLATNPRFGPTIAPRFDSVRNLDSSRRVRWRAWRNETSARLQAMLPPGTFLLMPSAPSIAPRRFLRGEDGSRFYDAALTLCSVAGHAGLAAVNLPIAELNECPLGLSLLAGRGQDEALLMTVVNLA